MSEIIMNESIKNKSIELGKKIRRWLKNNDITRVSVEIKNIFLEYNNLINKIYIDNWTEENIDTWFDIGNRSQNYIENFWVEGGFSNGTNFEKKYSNLILEIYHLIDENWFFKFRPEIYEELYIKNKNL